MKIATSLVIFSTFFFATSVHGQRESSKTKKPLVRATVTIKGEPYKPPVYPPENEPALWNEYSTKDGSIVATFPSERGKLSDDSEVLDNREFFLPIAANTKNATYQLSARTFPPIKDNTEINSVLEDSVKRAFTRPMMKIISKKDIYYHGFLGKELIISRTVAEGEYTQYARLFILNSKLITVNVSLNHGVSKEKMEPWIRKFFDSLKVHL